MEYWKNTVGNISIKQPTNTVGDTIPEEVLIALGWTREETNLIIAEQITLDTGN